MERLIVGMCLLALLTAATRKVLEPVSPSILEACHLACTAEGGAMLNANNFECTCKDKP